MASGRSDDFPGSSDEEEDFFAGFTVEEIDQMRQDRQRRRQQELLRDVDEEIDALIDQEPQESASNSDLRFLLMMAMKKVAKAAMKKLLVTQIPMTHHQIDFSGQIHYVESM